MAPVTMKDDALPQIHLVRDTDLGVFAYELHILAGDFLRESEFNLRSLATNTGPDSIAIMGKNHIWLADALSAYYPTGELYRMAAMTEYPGARAFLFHTERKEDGRLYGDVLMTDLDTLRQDIGRNTLYPYGVNMEYRDGTKAEAGIEKWEAMELCEKDALKTWHYLYAPEQVTEWQYRYSNRFSQWKAQAFSYMPQDLEERLNVEYILSTSRYPAISCSSRFLGVVFSSTSCRIRVLVVTMPSMAFDASVLCILAISTSFSSSSGRCFKYSSCLPASLYMAAIRPRTSESHFCSLIVE